MQRHHTTPSSVPRASYIDNATLGAQIVACRLRRQRGVSDELAHSVLAIGLGVWGRYRYTRHSADFLQEVMLRFLKYGFRKIDPKQNPFSYITTMAMRVGLKMREKEANRLRRETQYGEVVGEIADRLHRQQDQLRIYEDVDEADGKEATGR